MENRLSLIGGGGGWINLWAALKIGGFRDPEPIYQGMENNEFEFKNDILFNGDPRNERSFIQIESGSYIAWLERRNEFAKEEIRQIFYQILAGQREILVKIGYLQHVINIQKSQEAHQLVQDDGFFKFS